MDEMPNIGETIKNRIREEMGKSESQEQKREGEGSKGEEQQQQDEKRIPSSLQV